MRLGMVDFQPTGATAGPCLRAWPTETEI